MADVTLPQLGETVTEGTIVQWLKNVGDTVSEDEPLFEVSTDKVDTEVPSPVAGLLVTILVEEGATVEVGTVIAIIGESDDSAPAAPVGDSAPTPLSAAAPAVDPAASADPESKGGRRLLSPVVRRLVSEHGLALDTIPGTGPGGRVTRRDVEVHIDARSTAPQPSTPTTARPGHSIASASQAPLVVVASPSPAITAGERDSTFKLSKIRRLTGDHMVMSKATSPHAFSVVEVDYANVDITRGAIKQDWQQRHGFNLTYLPFICRAVIDGLGEFPHLNASVGTHDLIVHNFIDLAIAVDLDYEGLLAPVVRDADTKRLAAIATEIAGLAKQARNRQLGPDQISGGTFTISNNGSAGSVLTMPIINQPQVGIISTDAIVRKPVVVTGAHGGEAIAIHPIGNIAMCWDHRAFDGAYAAGFLKRVKGILETKDWSSEVSLA